jgi:hypothetical protein
MAAVAADGRVDVLGSGVADRSQPTDRLMKIVGVDE